MGVMRAHVKEPPSDPRQLEPHIEPRVVEGGEGAAEHKEGETRERMAFDHKCRQVDSEDVDVFSEEEF